MPLLGAHTLSPEPLPLAALLLFNRGLRFTPTPPCITRQQLTAAFLRFERTVRLRCMFGGGKAPKFRVRKPLYQPKEAEPVVERWLRRVQGGLMLRYHQLTSGGGGVRRRAADNLCRTERAALAALKQRADLVIKPADKNLGLTIIPVADYRDAQAAQVTDARVYSEVSDLPAATRAAAASLRALARQCPPALDEHLSAYIESGVQLTRPPSLYIMPKLHKMCTLADRPIKCRPIAACHSWVTTPASRYLADVLNGLLTRYPTVLRDRDQLCRELSSMRVHRDAWLVTFDVAELYPNCPHSGVVDACLAAMLAAGQPPPLASWHARLLRFVLTHNIVTVQDRHYKQICGGAMGTNCMPPAAQLYLAIKWEGLLRSVRERTGQHFPEFYRRYIDDGFTVWHGTEQSLLAFLQDLNTLLPHIRITWQYSQTQVEFLDLVVGKCCEDAWCSPAADGTVRLRTRTHQKALNLYLYIPYSSHHPPGMFASFVHAELLRYVHTCSDQHWYDCMVRKLTHRLRRRGYPTALLQRLIDRVDFAARRAQFLRSAPPAADGGGDSPIVLALPYASLIPELQPQQLLYHTYTSADPELRTHLPSRPIVAFQKCKSLAGHLVKASH